MNFVANKEFTDRESYKEILDNAFQSAINGKKSFVTTVYGFGGKGKTALCTQLLTKIIPEKYSDSLISVHVDFSIQADRAVDQCLLTIREKLSKTTKIKFPVFDLAFLTYYQKTKKEGNLRRKFPWLFVDEIPLLNKLIDAAGSFIPGVSFGFELLKEIGRKDDDSYLKQNLEIITDLDKLTTTEIENRFPDYIAFDLNNHFNKHPNQKKIVIVIDHYEKLWEDRSNKTGIGSLSVDAWIRKIVDIFPKQVFFIIFGRDKLRWELIDALKYSSKDLLDQHSLDSFSDEDADDFLRKFLSRKEVSEVKS